MRPNKLGSSKTPILFFAFFLIFTYILFSAAFSETNLLTNPGAEDGLTGWTFVNGGNGWTTDWGNPRTGSKAFGSSYDWCTMYQTVNLLDKGYSAAYLDTSPDINISTWVRKIFASDYYQVRVILKDADGGTITSFDTGSLSIATDDYQGISHTFSGYPSGVRQIYFEQKGKDGEYWSGYYGSYFDDASVTVASPSIPFTIEASAGANGTIEPSGSIEIISGNTQIFTIEADAGYGILDVLVDGASVGSVSEYTFSSVSANHTILASFEPVYVITSEATGNGTIEPYGTTEKIGTSDQIYGIIPTTGYHVDDVLVDGTSIGAVNVYTFEAIAANHTIEATFAIDTYTLISTAGANGSIIPSGITTKEYGESQIYTITPNSGNDILDVRVDGMSVGATQEYRFTSVSSNHTIEALFAPLYTITAEATGNGTIEPYGQLITIEGSGRTYGITPNIGYYVLDVKVDGVSQGTTSVYTFEAISANHTIEATFAINTYTLISTAGANGSISPSGIATKEYGESQTYTMTPSTGYHVLSVIDNGSVNSGTTEYTVSSIVADHTIIASFEIDTLMMTSEATAGGTVEPYGTVTSEYGTDRSYSIVPNSGYGIFDVLVDGTSVGAVNVYTFEAVATHHRILASFEPLYVITSEAGSNGTIEPYGTTIKVGGTSQTYTITADSGYSVSDVLVDGSSVGAVNTYTFSSVSANHRITASFEIIPVYVPSAEPFSNVTTSVIKANWGANGNPSGTMYYCENMTKGTNSGWITGLNWSSTSLEATTSYEFRVKAKESGGAQESGWTLLGTEETAGYTTVEGSIAGVDVKDGDTIPSLLTITVSLTSESIVTTSGIKKQAILGGVRGVYVNDVAVSYEVVSISDTSVTVRLGAALAAGTYTIKVITYDTEGTEYLLERTGLEVKTGSVVTVGPTLLYPNPYDPLAGDLKITYYLSVDKDITIYVIDTSGRVVWKSNYLSGTNGGKAGYNEVSWDSVGTFGQLPSGGYIVSVMEQGTGRLITKTKLLLWKGGAR